MLKENYKLTESEKDLLEEIKDYAKDTHSDKYFSKKIKQFGEGIAREILSESRYQHRLGNIKKTKKEHITYLFESDPANKEKPPFKTANKSIKTIGDKKTNLLKFVDIVKASKEIDKTINAPYIEKSLSSAREINQFLKVLTLTDNAFFSQTTNPKKTEEVILMSYPTMIQGKEKYITLVKGKAFKNDKARGMLKIFNHRVIYALTSVWEEYGSWYMEYTNNTKICFCNVSVKNIADMLGYKNLYDLGGRQYTKIKRAISDLENTPFYFDFSELEGEVKSVTFKFLQTATFTEYRNNNIPTTIRVEFSPLYSNMLMERQTIRRSKALCKIKNSLMFLLLNHVEKSLIKVGRFKANLMTLINSLKLNNAKWHNFKGNRKKEFEKITESEDFKNYILSDGSTMSRVEYELNKDKDDYIMKITTRKIQKVIDTTCQVAV
ncbi:hypothetical protein AGMMS50222_08050 [Endomicrobiia bacterium]|nr:hypothetical protein AGMMS49556_05580 [Endomicrobiia bacterium]GHT76032.1 hypothetical protein AGMMS50222_08050 [Endomicrobiia bacterium]